MDYEKAFGRAKSAYGTGAYDDATLEFIFPQLAESEDKRIRKELVAFFIEVRNREGNEGYWHDLKVADILTYLEKQKECVADSSKTSADEDERTMMWIANYIHRGVFDEEEHPKALKAVEWLEKQKEQKSVQSDVEREYVRTLKSLISDFLRGKEKVDREYYQQIFDWLDGRHVEQKEHIPFADFAIKPHKGDDNNPYDMSVSEAQEYAIKRGFGIPFNNGEVYVEERHLTQTIGNIIRWADEHPKEQKPADYNEYKMLIDGAREHGRIEGRKEVIDHPEEYGLTKQKPAEWSKEDEETLKDIIAGLEATKQLTYRHDPSGRACYNRWIAWLKSLRPQPHWKPSEEQMKALWSVWMGGDTPVMMALGSLLEDLKKLM